MTRHCPDLGSVSDWLKFASTNQKHKQYPDLGSSRHHYGISAFVSQTLFRGETRGGVAKYRLFSQATLALETLAFQSIYGGKIDLINLNDKLPNLF